MQVFVAYFPICDNIIIIKLEIRTFIIYICNEVWYRECHNYNQLSHFCTMSQSVTGITGIVPLIKNSNILELWIAGFFQNYTEAHLWQFEFSLSMDKKEGRRCHLLHIKRWYLLPPFRLTIPALDRQNQKLFFRGNRSENRGSSMGTRFWKSLEKSSFSLKYDEKYSFYQEKICKIWPSGCWPIW
jgi:hypothetical protein